MFQDTSDHGFPATYAPLPAFTPDYTLNRAFNVQPEASDDWALPSLDLKYAAGLVARVLHELFLPSHVGHRGLDLRYRSRSSIPTTGSTHAPGAALPVGWRALSRSVHRGGALLLRPVQHHDLSGTVGAFYSKTHTLFEIPPTYANGLVAATADNTVVGPWPNDEIWQQNNPGLAEGHSLFGELYYKFLDKFNLTLGARQYWLSQDADFTANGFMNFGADAKLRRAQQRGRLQPEGEPVLSGHRRRDGLCFGLQGLPRRRRAGLMRLLQPAGPAAYRHHRLEVRHALEL